MIERVEAALRAQRIETPSWAFGNSGTRFAVFPQAGVPRTTREKIEDAAQVHRYTGVAPSVALHIPWDRVDDYAELREFAAALGLGLGAINPNLFQEPEYKLGSFCNPDERVRRASIDHLLECIEIAGQTGSDSISLWLADGTNYPGQDSLSARRERIVTSLQEVYEAMPEQIELLVEYKLYEPAFYATDLADWGSALHALPGARAAAHACSSTSATTPTASTSSRSSRCSSGWIGSAGSTSTIASTATTT